MPLSFCSAACLPRQPPSLSWSPGKLQLAPQNPPLLRAVNQTGKNQSQVHQDLRDLISIIVTSFFLELRALSCSRLNLVPAPTLKAGPLLILVLWMRSQMFGVQGRARSHPACPFVAELGFHLECAYREPVFGQPQLSAVQSRVFQTARYNSCGSCKICLVRRAGYIICGAQSEMKTQDPCSKHQGKAIPSSAVSQGVLVVLFPT